MKRILTALLLSCITLSTTFAMDKVSDFNFDWKFSLSDNDRASKRVYNDKDWADVRLPHDWSIELGYTQEGTAGSNGFLPGGIGWYRKSFKLPTSIKEKRVFIHFEGVYSQSEVWINGHSLGFYPNGYVGFEYELTPYLRYGNSENVISVRVDRQEFADTRWYVGGGIYRNVQLLVRDDMYIPTSGVSITTPKVSREMAEVSVDLDIAQSANRPAEVEVCHQLYIGDNLVQTVRCDTLLTKNINTLHSTIALPNPMLWSLEQPSLYTLKTTLTQGGEQIDEQLTPFGVRSIRFDAAHGFFLNDQFVKIKGVNIHHDLGCMGVASYDAVLYRRLKALKEMGCNAVRTAHNPHSVSLLAMCDTMGLMVMNEMFDEWKASKSKWIKQRSGAKAPKEVSTGYVAYFKDWAEHDLKNFIRRDRNHPSVILWSIGNELEWTYPYYWSSSLENKKGIGGLVHQGGPEMQNDTILKRFNELCGGYDELSETAKQLVEWTKEVDTTRPVTLGANLPSVSRLSGLMDVLDVVGYNYKNTYYEIDHKRYPNQPILGTENVGQYHEWRAVMDKDYIPGIFVWTGISYLGESGPWPSKGSNSSFLDFACFKRSRAHFYECLWKDTPKTHIVTTPAADCEFKQNEDGTFRTEFNSDMRKSELRGWDWFETFDKWCYADGEPIIVQVYSNAPQVELFLNDQSLGIKNRNDFAEENILLWQVPYEAGELVAVGRVNGCEVSRHRLATNGDATTFAIKVDKKEVKADRYDVAHIEVSLLDAAGEPVTDQVCEVQFSVDENSKIVGIDNGSSRYVGSHKTDHIVTNLGKCLLIVQSKEGTKGDSKITVKLENGATQQLVLKYI